MTKHVHYKLIKIHLPTLFELKHFTVNLSHSINISYKKKLQNIGNISILGQVCLLKRTNASPEDEYSAFFF